MAYPHKGERALVGGRIPLPYYRKLNAVMEAKGMTKNDFIADLIMQRLDEIDLDEVHPDQEKLSLTV